MSKFAMIKTVFCALAASVLCVGVAAAAPIYQSNFNTYAGSAASAQADTGLLINAFGSVSGWNGAGMNALHAVQRQAGDWAIMLYDTNVITMSSGIAANSAGSTYKVAFDGAAGSYNNRAQASIAGDTMRFEIINVANQVLASYTYLTPAWTSSATNAFVAASFEYVGNGSGAVRLRVSDTLQNGRFGGAFDNVSVSAVPEPASVLLMMVGLAGLAAAQRKRAA